MNILLILIVIGVIALSLAALVPYLPGYVFLSVGEYNIETSLLAFLIAVLLLMGGIWLLSWLIGLPSRMADRHSEKLAEKRLEQGMLALSEGDYERAEKALAGSAEASYHPTAGYLAAAQAAHGDGAESRREFYLARADEATRSHRTVALTRAQILIDNAQPEAALEVLDQYRQKGKRKARALELRRRAYEMLGRWDEIAELTPALSRAGVLSEEQADQLRSFARRQQLIQAESAEQLVTIFESLPPEEQNQAQLLETLAVEAAHRGRGELALRRLEEALDGAYNPSLVAIYTQIEGGDTDHRRDKVMHWTEAHANNAHLWFALGGFERQLGNTEGAFNAYERALALDEIAEAHEQMAELLIEKGEDAKAAQHLKKALALQKAGSKSIVSRDADFGS